MTHSRWLPSTVDSSRLHVERSLVELFTVTSVIISFGTVSARVPADNNQNCVRFHSAPPGGVASPVLHPPPPPHRAVRNVARSCVDSTAVTLSCTMSSSCFKAVARIEFYQTDMRQAYLRVVKTQAPTADDGQCFFTSFIDTCCCTASEALRELSVAFVISRACLQSHSLNVGKLALNFEDSAVVH